MHVAEYDSWCKYLSSYKTIYKCYFILTQFSILNVDLEFLSMFLFYILDSFFSTLLIKIA